jgi:hypothetical protein
MAALMAGVMGPPSGGPSVEPPSSPEPLLASDWPPPSSPPLPLLLPEELPLEEPLPEELPLEEPLPEELVPEELVPEELPLEEVLPEELPLEELVPELEPDSGGPPVSGVLFPHAESTGTAASMNARRSGSRELMATRSSNQDAGYDAR